MTERPILFSGEMVRAILDGRKTQTRRVMSDRDPWVRGMPSWVTRCPYGEAGDRLWVRETWGLFDTEPSDGPVGARVFYRATEGDHRALRYQLWRPSIHMPRWASRITLEVTGVRVERLQAIRTADVVAEGVDVPAVDYSVPDHPWQLETEQLREARAMFRELWDGINARRGHSWESNPWVWVVSFSRLEVDGSRRGGDIQGSAYNGDGGL